MRAILLAGATAATLGGRRSIRPASRGILAGSFLLAWRITGTPPSTVRAYQSSRPGCGAWPPCSLEVRPRARVWGEGTAGQIAVGRSKM